MQNRQDQAGAESPPLRLSRYTVKALLTYLLFGLAFWVVMLAYVAYRERVGQPPDLSISDPTSASMLLGLCLLAWPLLALEYVVDASAVAVPGIVVRAVGIIWLSGFAVLLAWLLRRPR